MSDDASVWDDPVDESEAVGARQLPDPLTPVSDAPPSEVPLSDAERAALAAQVRSKDVKRLMEEVTALYGRVEAELADSGSQAARAHALLNEARTLLMARPAAYPTAELRVQQVRLLLARVAVGHTVLAGKIRGLAMQAVAWLLAFALLFALDGLLAQALAARGWLTLPAGGPASLSLAFAPWLPMLAGGMGGALGALILLGTQQHRYEFEPGSTLDYTLNAPKGAIWGVVAFYLMLGGFLTTAAITAQATNALTATDQLRAASSPLMLIVAFLFGFAQPRLMRLLRRVWGDVTGDREEEKVPLPAPAPVALPPAPPPAEPGEAGPVRPTPPATRYPEGATHQTPRPE